MLKSKKYPNNSTLRAEIKSIHNLKEKWSLNAIYGNYYSNKVTHADISYFDSDSIRTK